MGIEDYSTTAGSNTSVGGVSIAEGMSPASVNNAIRAVMADIATARQDKRSTFIDDFLAGAIEARLSSTAGAGAGTEVLTVVSGSLNGTATLKSSTALGTHAQNCAIVTMDQLNYTAGQGGLAMETRLSINDITTVALFVGFTDTISTTVELPVYKASGADDLDSDATNACGVGFDTQGTTDQWWHGGVKADTDTAATHSGSAPVNATLVTIRVEVSSAGAVEGFINGVSIGTAVANAVTTSTPLTPVIVIGNRAGSAQRIATIDYIFVEQAR